MPPTPTETTAPAETTESVLLTVVPLHVGYTTCLLTFPFFFLSYPPRLHISIRPIAASNKIIKITAMCLLGADDKATLISAAQVHM